MLHIPPPSFDSHVLKFERAQEHFQVLHDEMHAYLAPANPCDLVGQLNPHTGEYVLRMVVTRYPPPRLAVLAGDCLQNLRSALDHLVWQLTFRYVGKDSERCEFPICLTRNAFTTGTPGGGRPGIAKLRDVAPPAQARIERLQPYHRTDGPPDLHPLWLLHRLNNRDKHRTLELAVAIVSAADIRVSVPPGVAYDIIEQTTGRLNDGAVFARLLFRVSPAANEAKVNLDGRRTAQVAFDEEGEGRGLPLIPTVAAMITSVEQVLRALAPYL